CEADAAGEGRGEIVCMALELDADGEKLLRVELLPGRVRAGHEPERDHGGARAEAALPRDPAYELEPPSRDGREPGERLHAEMRIVHLAVAVLDLELVPEVERGRDAVEAR